MITLSEKANARKYDLNNLKAVKRSYERLIEFHKNYQQTLLSQHSLTHGMDDYISAALTYYTNMLEITKSRIKDIESTMWS